MKKGTLQRTPLPQPTGPMRFRQSFSFSLESGLCDLLSELHQKHNVNLSQEFEPVIKRKAANLARKHNKTNEKRVDIHKRG